MRFDLLPLTETQARAVRHAVPASGRRAVFRLPGVPDSERLARALTRVAEQCQALRWRVVDSEDGPRYQVHEYGLNKLEVIDLDVADELGVLSTISMLGDRPLRIDTGAPWAMTLLRGQTASFLVFVCHPGLLDRFSLQPLFRALSQAFSDEPVDARLSLDQQALASADRHSRSR